MVKAFLLLLAVLLSLASADQAPRILGGTETSRTGAPWQVFLEARVPGSFTTNVCGGTIIDKRVILTAAHCVNAPADTPLPDVQVVILKNSKSERTTRGGDGAIYDEKARVVMHKDYSFTRRLSDGANDLALLFLPSDIPLERGVVEAIKLTKSEPPVGLKAIQSGYGQTLTGDVSDILRKGYTTVQKCPGSSPGVTTPGIFCSTAHDSAGNNDGVCSGDSGGPAVSNGYLIGVTSMVTQECHGISVWCDVAHGRTWIEATLRANGFDINTLGGRQVVLSDDPSKGTGFNENGASEPSLPRPNVVAPPPIARRESDIVSQLGRCHGGFRPINFYDSGCTRRESTSTSCVQGQSVPAPLGTMSIENIREMQSLTGRALITGDTANCCWTSEEKFFCRAPRGGFAQGTPGARPEDMQRFASAPRVQSPPLREQHRQQSIVINRREQRGSERWEWSTDGRVFVNGRQCLNCR